MNNKTRRIQAILSNLPYKPEFKTVSQLQAICNDVLGENISKRTYERDLKSLEADELVVPCSEDKEDKANKWSLNHESGVLTQNITIGDALSLVILKQFAGDFLPPSSNRYMNNVFCNAEVVLNKGTCNDHYSTLRKWPEKLVLERKGLSLTPIEIDDEIKDKVYLALLKEEKLKIRYKKQEGSKAVVYDRVICPLGLIVRTHIQYLVAFNDGGEPDDLRMFALNRILEADRTSQEFLYPSDFCLKSYVDQGQSGHVFKKGKCTIEFSVSGFATEIVQEAPINPTMKLIEMTDNCYRYSVEAQYNYDIESFLLSLSSNVKVESPQWLVELFAEKAKKMAALYQ